MIHFLYIEATSNRDLKYLFGYTATMQTYCVPMLTDYKQTLCVVWSSIHMLLPSININVLLIYCLCIVCLLLSGSWCLPACLGIVEVRTTPVHMPH